MSQVFIRIFHGSQVINKYVILVHLIQYRRLENFEAITRESNYKVVQSPKP
jgi:hypothetical protein